MTKNSDEMAFKEAYNKINVYDGYELAQREMWQAALDYERKRSEKLKEALEFYQDREVYKIGSDVSHSLGFDGEVIEEELVLVMRDDGEIARQALQEYQARENNGFN
jgi:hypothetical protein